VIGALLAGALFIYYYRLVPESELWRSANKATAPLKQLFSGSDLLRLGQLLVVMTGAWLTLNATVGALPGVINTILGVKSSGVNTGILIGAVIAAAVYPLIGQLSQKFGRRPTITAIGILSLVPACALYYVLVATAYRNPVGLVVLVALIELLSLPIWAVHTPYLAESFPTGIRSSGYGVSYSLAAILPGLYSFTCWALPS
jgi:MFS family permease